MSDHNTDDNESQPATSQPPAKIGIAVNRTHVGKLPRDDPRWGPHTASFTNEWLDVQGIADEVRSGYAITATHSKRRDSDHFVSHQLMGLDYDTEDERSTFATLQADPFIGDYAAIIHTSYSHTPDKPRARVLLILDKPISSATLYARYARALVWFAGCADKQCGDAARLWFGAPGCEMVVRPERVLPVAVLDAIADAHTTHLAEQAALHPATDINPAIDTGGMLARAIEDGTPGQRNATGFWLACQLRDSGMSQADAGGIMAQYVASVPPGNHPYTATEAQASLVSAYSHKPRGHTNAQVETDLSYFTWFAWNERAGAKQGGIHYSLETITAINELCRAIKRTQGINLPIRDFDAYGVPPPTAARHLKALVVGGWLVLDKRSNRVVGTTYSLNVTRLRAMASERQQTSDKPVVWTVEQSPIYVALKGMDAFRHGAKIDARLWPVEPPTETFGPAMHRLIATLASHGQGGHRAEGVSRQGSTFDTVYAVGRYPAIDCIKSTTLPRDTQPGGIESLGQLYETAGINDRVGREKLRLLETLKIARWEFGEHGSKVPYLVDGWYERLIEISPALTTFGRGVLNGQSCDNQRMGHHEWFSRKIKGPNQRISLQALEQAGKRSNEYDVQIQALNQQRAVWATSQGIVGDVPSISTHGQPREKKVQQPVTLSGNALIPAGRIHTGTNGPLLAERADFGPPPPTDEELLYQDATNRAIADWNGDNEHDKTTSNEDQQGHHTGGGTRTSRAPKGVGHAARPALVPTGDDSSGTAHCQPDRRGRDGLHLSAAPSSHHKTQGALGGNP